ncbi:hypothetical protein HK099_000652 [Clydaea vesicula]|uniref:Myb-like domain-containing protein n=1 Tax=Clydaea vesicula TaxID=447962 RepID=A0AAD5Y1J6_9FUNG|nr:hypothetical protein HK099_000652 [Clydaea vesicula]
MFLILEKQLNKVFDVQMREYIWKFVKILKHLSFTEDIPIVTIKKARKYLEEINAVFIDVTDLTLEQIQNRYGDKVRILASEERRRCSLIGNNDSSVKISPEAYQVLEEIAKTREVGLTQADAAKNMALDSKTIFYYIKYLNDLDLIVKIPIAHQPVHTSLLIHRSFKNQNEVYIEQKKKEEEINLERIIGLPLLLQNVQESTNNETKRGLSAAYSELTKQRITTLLQSAKQQTLLIHDVMVALNLNFEAKSDRKWFYRLLSKLEADGYIEKINVLKRVKAKERSNQGASDKCIRFLKLYSISQEDYKARKLLGDPESDLVFGNEGLLADMTLENQILRIVQMAGAEGATAGVILKNSLLILRLKTIERSLNNMSKKLSQRVLQKMLKSDNNIPDSIGLKKVSESVGRERRYRYYADPLPEIPQIEANASVNSSNANTEDSDTILVPSKDTRQHIVTPALRKSCFLQLLEEREMIDLGQEFTTAFEELLNQEKKIDGEKFHRVDKRTIERVAESLKKENKLKIYSVQIPQLNGAHKPRKLCVLPGLKFEDAKVKDYIEMLMDKTYLSQVRVKPQEQEDLNIFRTSDMDFGSTNSKAVEDDSPPVNALGINESTSGDKQSEYSVVYDNNDRSGVDTNSNLPAIEYDLEASDLFLKSNYIEDEGLSGNCDDFSNGRRLEEHLQLLSQKRMNEKVNEEVEYAMPIAQDYGYINAIMLRTRTLHEYLFAKLRSASSSCFKNNGIFRTATLFQDMPLELYLKIIGVFHKSKLVEKFIEHPVDIALKDLSTEMKRETTGKKNSLRPNIKRMIDILVALCILNPVNETNTVSTKSDHDEFNFQRRYKFNSRVPLYNHSLETKPFIRFYAIDSLESIAAYWANLEFICVKKGVKKRIKMSISDTSQLPGENSPYLEQELESDNEALEVRAKKKSPLYAITNARNWIPPFIFTVEERNSLNPYTNPTTGESPYENAIKCKAISLKHGLATNSSNIPMRRVKNYFQRFEANFIRKQLLKDNRKKERKIIDTLEKTKKKKKPVTTETSKDIRREVQNAVLRGGSAGNLALVNNEILPVVETDVYHTYKRKRGDFTEEEDRLLLVAASVIEAIWGTKRAGKWLAVSKLFKPPRIIPYHNCRRRFAVLINRTAEKEAYESMIAKFKVLYPKGIETGVFSNVTDLNPPDIDIYPMVNYLIENQNMRVVKERIVLPSDVKTLQNKFIAERYSADIDISEKLESEELRSLVKKMTFLYSIPLTCPMNNSTEIDFSNDLQDEEKQISSYSVKGFIKMLLLTEEKNYDEQSAFSILQSFSDVNIPEILQQLQQEQLIATKTGKNNRSIPGRGFHLSERFSFLLKGYLPDRFFDQLISFKDTFSRVESCLKIIPIELNSGTMGCILDLISAKTCKLELNFDKHKGSADIDLSLIKLEDYEVNTKKRKLDSLNEKAPYLETPLEVAKIRRKEPVSPDNLYMETVEEEDIGVSVIRQFNCGADAERVYNTILNSGVLGIFTWKLKEVLNIESKKLHQIITTLKNLNHPKLPINIIAEVGYQNICLVSYKYLGQWSISTVISENKSERNFVQTYCWHDINGNLVSSIWNSSLEVVLSLIVTFPGIYEV